MEFKELEITCKMTLIQVIKLLEMVKEVKMLQQVKEQVLLLTVKLLLLKTLSQR